ncbi:phospholipase A2 [Nemania sp. FL0916]|nr:phospholipase A2 [Nemania sp. FL0916]
MAQRTTAAEARAIDRWTSLLSRLNPVPQFPEFTGPYKVGTVDVEIPVSKLDSPAPAPDSAIAAGIETVQFRIFYPCDPNATGKRITWLPAPQRDYLSAYIKFVGVGAFLAEAASFFPRHVHWTTIPVIDDAPLLSPDSCNTSNGRWPTMIFSHGLGGSRNAYSQLVGALASHGVVVFCPEHRDGSAIASAMRVPPSPQPPPKQEGSRFWARSTAAPTPTGKRMIPYLQIAHDATDEVHEARNAQLRIRLWELGLVHAAALAIDEDGDGDVADYLENPEKLSNINIDFNMTKQSLAHFAGKLDVHTPGSIIFAGHSYGAASIVQFLKSVFYAGRPELEAMTNPLYAPRWDAPICRQVTPRNVTLLLDMWCFPLLAKSTAALYKLPLPVYAPGHDQEQESGEERSEEGSEEWSQRSLSPSLSPGGNALLAIASEDFYKWREQLVATARILSPDPTGTDPYSTIPTTTTNGDDISIIKRAATDVPHYFYVQRSAHLNQSDFGVLFPWLTRKVCGSEEPWRALRLNLRAILQVLRINRIAVAGTRGEDLIDGWNAEDGDGSICLNDTAILNHGRNAIRDDNDIATIVGTVPDELVRAWRWIDCEMIAQERDPARAHGAKNETETEKEKEDGDLTTDEMDEMIDEKSVVEQLEDSEPQMAGVIEPIAANTAPKTAAAIGNGDDDHRIVKVKSQAIAVNTAVETVVTA